MTISNTDPLINFLDAHESSPSACVLARTIYRNIKQLPDDEVNAVYNRAESANDAERNDLISKMTDTQLVELYAIAMEILMEKHDELEQ